MLFENFNNHRILIFIINNLVPGSLFCFEVIKRYLKTGARYLFYDFVHNPGFY